MCAKQSGIKNAMHAEARLTGACLLPNHNSHVVIIQIYRKHREHCSGAAAADSSNVRLGCEHELQPVAVVPQVTVATHKVQLTAGQCSHSHKGATATLPDIPHRRHFFALLSELIPEAFKIISWLLVSVNRCTSPLVIAAIACINLPRCTSAPGAFLRPALLSFP